MRKSEVILDFLRLPYAGKVEFGRNMVLRMTGNLSFPTPDVPLSQITTASNSLETAFNAAQGGGPQQTAALHLASKQWDGLMRKLAIYVNRIADGNEAMILSSGFHTTHQPKPALHPEFRVEHGELSGEIVGHHKAYKGRSCWVWQYCEDPIPADGSWKLAGVSIQASFVYKELVPGTKYWFRVALVTYDGQGPWSDPAVLIAM
jgi:hypothetical protein